MKETRTYAERREYNKQAVVKRRRKMKKILVDAHGGKCTICGYSKSVCALDFHHLDPTIKESKIIGTTLSLERQMQEAEKCILVCSNCHREIHEKLGD